ncbi:MAG: DUF2190 family protein [Helicobacteraceae bacterium]|nr:DUF2190 family protein [Helicobacteraceae bacterium]
MSNFHIQTGLRARQEGYAQTKFKATGAIEAYAPLFPSADRVEIARSDAVAGDLLARDYKGAFYFALKPGDAPTSQTTVYWNAANQSATVTGIEGRRLGVVEEIITDSGGTFVIVSINDGVSYVASSS